MPVRTLFPCMVALTLLVGCGSARSTNVTENAKPSDGHYTVVTTMSTLNSFVIAVAGERVTVRNLVPVGASPETYAPTPTDIALLRSAALVVENGAGLETWLARTLDNAKNPKLVRVVCTDGLPIKGTNPHLWMDPVLAQRYVDKIRVGLGRVDPGHRSQYAARASQYDARLAELTKSIQRKINTIPAPQRNMIVFHNAWQYYNDRFGLRTIGVVELSPGQEPNPQYIGQLVQLAKQNQVRAVFAEPEYSPKLIQTLAQSAGVKTVENLYDDSVGNVTGIRNYVEMLEHDTDVIVKALR
ncbi:MAG: zinc ABC transporter substrate-binding protein [Candidatus Eremiobacteraeota bacterium]|nr:zinc ABC transporter substrate-binding protein [Candidatus Eremiobacteraeota bacterium]